MTGLKAALWSETLKAGKSKVFAATILMFAFVAMMMGLLMFVANHPSIAGRSAVVGAKASRLGNGDWSGYLSLLIQTILALGQLGYGIVASWVFGREYSDKTVKDLLALPVPRASIVVAKFIVILLWCILLSGTLFATALVTGLAVAIPGWSAALVERSFFTFSIGALLTITLCTPVAFVASAGRGFLLPIGVVLLLLIIAQLVGMGIPAATLYFPWAIPALCAGAAGSALPVPGPASYFVLGATTILGFFATIALWNSADQK